MRLSTALLSCVAIATAVMGSNQAFADSPRHFLQSALQGDNSEMMLGRLAADRARNPRVRDYGRMLSSDHHNAREEILQIGARMGVRRNRDLTPEAAEERDKLQNMEGREFDREFIRYMIDDHRKDIADFRDEARENHGPVSELAARQLPTLEKHLDMAMELGRPRDRGPMDPNSRDEMRGAPPYRSFDRNPGPNDREMNQQGGYGADRNGVNR